MYSINKILEKEPFSINQKKKIYCLESILIN